MFTTSILLPYDDDRIFSKYEYKTAQDAEWHMRMLYRRYFDTEDEFIRNVAIYESEPFVRGWFTDDFVPFYSCFKDGELLEIVQEYYQGMEKDFVKVSLREYSYPDDEKEIIYWVYFWSSPDLEKAKVIAEGYLRGWLAAKGV